MAARPGPQQQPLLLVVEGANDESFLKAVSGILSAADHAIPNLSWLSASGQVVFIPFGGGSPLSWAKRLASLGCRKVHLYDRELPPESDCGGRPPRWSTPVRAAARS